MTSVVRSVAGRSIAVQGLAYRRRVALPADGSGPGADRSGLELISDALTALERDAQRCVDLGDFRNDPLVLADLRRVDEMLWQATQKSPSTLPQLAEAAYELALCSFVLGTAVLSGEQGHLDAARARHRRVSEELPSRFGLVLGGNEDGPGLAERTDGDERRRGV
jgi:hypothetical protein